MIHEELQDVINGVLAEREDKHGWDRGLFANILLVSADQRGEIGERLIERLLKKAGVPGVTRAGKVDRTKKHWDIRTDDMDIEVKTATLGRNINTFQHESIEKDRDYTAMIFVDIAPGEIYITCTAKKNIDWNSLHRRANSIFYKWDMTLKDVARNRVSTISNFSAAYERLKKEVAAD
ncbi:MAG: hypothetical protein OD918_04795 [Gammaproteobacteria bacterium]